MDKNLDALHSSAILIENEYITADTELPGLIAEALMDLLKWDTAIQGHFLKNASVFAVNGDYKNTALGNWLHEDDASMKDESFSDLKIKLRDSFRKLYLSAEDIKRTYAVVDKTFMYELERVFNNHKKWSEIIPVRIIEGSGKLGINTDSDKNEIKRFINSEKTQTYVRNFPGVRSSLEAVSFANDQTCTAAQLIDEGMATGDPEFVKEIYLHDFINNDKELCRHLTDAISTLELLMTQKQARYIYETKTAPLLADVRADLLKLKELSEERINSARRGLDIFVEKTLPSAAALNSGLRKIRSMIAEDDVTDESMLNSAQRTKIYIIISGIISIIAGFFMAFIISRAISRPIVESVKFAEKMAEGDFTSSIETELEDETGVLVRALSGMVSHTGSMLKRIGGGIENLSNHSVELTNISSAMSSEVDETSEKSEAVAKAAASMSDNLNVIAATMEQASANVSHVNTAIEDVASQAKDLTEKSNNARRITGKAVEHSNIAKTRVDELGKSARNIGTITATITDISAQTNLLALNATIEAARSGEAGRGFAVVANEIKDLARQTAEATEEIRKNIGHIQATTVETISDIEKMSSTADTVNEVVTTIASDLGAQEHTMDHISENIAQASQGMGDVNENVASSSLFSQKIAEDIDEVHQSSSRISAAGLQVNRSADELQKLAMELKNAAATFKV